MTERWLPPSKEEIESVIGMLVDPHLKQLFFAELQNPQWLKPLADLGAFASPPEVWVDEDGIERAATWPEGEFLARVASEEPTLVTDLLEARRDSRNPWVHRVVLEAALKLPPDHASRLVPQIATFVRSGLDWVDAPGVVTLAESLADVHIAKTRVLLAAVFEPKRGPKEVRAFGPRYVVGANVDSYWYAELAPRAVPLLARLGMDGLRLAVGWLTRADQIAAGDESPRSYAAIWRPSIAPHEQNSGFDEVSDALVDMVRDVASAIASTGSVAEVVDFLEARGDPLFSRLGVETVVAALAAPEPSDEAVHVGRRLLMTESLLEIDSRPEYVRLVRSLLPRLEDSDVSAWEALVVSNSWQGDDAVIRRMTEWGRTGEVAATPEEMARTRRRMRYRLFVPIRDVLPPALQADFEAMASEFGELEHPEFSSYMTAFAGPTSPIDDAALEAMAPDELFAFLNTWKPADDSHFGPSVEGLARQLETVAEHRPELVDELADRLTLLPRAYVKSALDGLAKAIPAGYVPSSKLWGLLREVVGFADSGDLVEGRPEDDDPVWRWAQRSAADFVAALLTIRGSELTASDAQQAWAVLRPLCSHADPTPAHEERYGGTNMDPLTLALNTTRPRALRTSITLLRQTTAIGQVELETLRSEILAELDRHIDVMEDPSLAVGAALGEGVGHIQAVDPRWIDHRTEALFNVLSPNEAVRARADVVVSVALRTYRTNTGFLELMRPVLSAMFSSAYSMVEHIEGWRGNRRSALVEAATHVVRAYTIGILDENDPLLVSLTAPAGPTDAFSAALGQVGWTVMRARKEADSPDPPPEVLTRCQRLIDQRVADITTGDAPASELAEFYWWVRADVFPPSWWLPVLKLANSDANFDPKGMLGESLARAAEVEPALTLDVFDALLSNSGEWKRFDLLQHAPRILAAALRSEQEATRSTARRLLDRLGRSGHMSILADVDQLLESAPRGAT